MLDEKPLLTIAIPTWNRSFYLQQTLNQIYQELKNCNAEIVEVLVSDNFSSDNTVEVVEKARGSGLNINYVRNKENIGSDANIAQCFNKANGKYVLILGDDDLLVDTALPLLLEKLSYDKYGVVCLRPYGFDRDFRKELPSLNGGVETFTDAGLFLVEIAALVTLISSCVISKKLLKDIDARDFCGENLVQVHLVIRAALVAKENLFVRRYMVACKRNNSGGYDFARVFVRNFGRILDGYSVFGLTKQTVYAIEARLLVGYFPFYLFKLRLRKAENLEATYQEFVSRYARSWRFYIWAAPILKLPRILALLWGGSATIIGRVLSGDMRRGMMFFVNKLFN